MNRFRLVVAAALSALWLAGCSLFPPRYDPAKPQVDIDPATKTISVVPRVLIFEKGQKDVTIVWQLPKGSALRFPANGIVIEGEITNRVVKGTTDAAPNQKAAASVVLDPDQKEIVDCRIRNDGTEFTCLNRHTRPGLFKYTIRVLQAGELIELDPAVMND